MVLVPYPFALNHQMENAKVFAKKGAAIILEESAADAGAFRDAITELVGDSAKRGALSSSARAMAVPDASHKLAKVVLDF